MRIWRDRLLQFRLLRYGASLNITVVCLFWLFVLVLWGTLYQVEHGLYAAQDRFFTSFLFSWYFLQLPGVQLILWVLFVNLLLNILLRFRFNWKKTGILVMHAGVLLFFVAGYITYQSCQEAELSLLEGEQSDIAVYRDQWEVALWQPNSSAREVAAFDRTDFDPGDSLHFDSAGITFTVEDNYTHSAWAPNLERLMSMPAPNNPREYRPGMVLTQPGLSEPIILHAALQPHLIEWNQQTYFLALQPKRLPLGFDLKLLDFRKQEHPGTEIARSFTSKVEVTTGAGARETVISMNEPLRYEDYTVYQASYSYDEDQNEISTFAVVKNSGRLLPYIATTVLVLGLAIHFVMQIPAVRRR